MLRAVCGSVILLALLSPALARGENFRMETDVLLGGKKEAVCQTLTLFTDSLVYDFIVSGDAGEVTVFDMSAGRVILLDTKKARKTVLSFEQLIELTTKMKVLTTEKDAVFHFAANPKFEIKDIPSSKAIELELTSPTMTYKVSAEHPEHKDVARRYQEFADWSARLNACRPGNLPPFARMELGKALVDRDLIPKEIVRTTISPGRLGNKKLELRSRHLVNWTLSANDKQRIDTVAEHIGKFEGVTFLSYVDAGKK